MAWFPGRYKYEYVKNWPTNHQTIQIKAGPQVVVCLLDAGVSVGREQPLCLAAQKGHHQARGVCFLGVKIGDYLRLVSY